MDWHIEESTFKAVNYRLSSTPATQLPSHITYLTNGLLSCQNLLSVPEAELQKRLPSAVPLIQRFRAQLSSLFQEKSYEGRWAAIVLSKAAVEAGGWEVLHKSKGWVQGLLGVLSKGDPPSSKKLAVIALTRIFILTHDYPTLVREITTPALKTYIENCLKLVSSSSANSTPYRSHAALVHVILDSFCRLLPNHPALFRGLSTSVTRLLTEILGYTVSPVLDERNSNRNVLRVSTGTTATAQRLWVLQHQCAPKNGSSEDWEKGVRSTVLAIHATADRVFRAMPETWESVDDDIRTRAPLPANEPEMIEAATNGLGMVGWKGIQAGVQRLGVLLGLLRTYLDLPTAASVTCRVGLVVDLLTRLCSVTVPQYSSARNRQSGERYNNEVSKVEREALNTALPGIHVASIQVLNVLLQRFESGVVSLLQGFLEQLMWVFSAERFSAELRSAIYSVVARILTSTGPSMSKFTVSSLKPLIQSCCDDLLSNTETSIASAARSNSLTNGKKSQSTTNADTFLTTTKSSAVSSATMSPVQIAALNILPIFITSLPSQHLSITLRTRIDRTAILLKDEKSMLASVLSPPRRRGGGKASGSTLAVLAREHGDKIEVEGLIRPRLPVIVVGEADAGEEDVTKADEESEGEDEEADFLNGRDTEMEQPEIEEIEMDTFTGTSALNTVHSEAEVQRLPPHIDQATSEGKRGPDSETPLDSPSAKRPRVETEPELEPDPMPNPVPTRTVVAVPVPVGAQRAATDQDAEDSESDFEIPEIDTNPDTDEEEENIH